MDAPLQDLQHELPSLLPRLWRFALRLTREKTEAEELLQRCCLRALERRAQWRPAEGALLSWLFAIMHSIWLNELRARNCRRKWSIDWDDEWVAQCPDNHAADPEQYTLYRQVVASLDALPEEQRDVLLLVAVEGFTYKEAAQVLCIPIGTVMSRLARARLAVGSRFVVDAVS